ncbi:MAG: hypothetical protein ACREVI_16030 [Steroidobacteraceae bacterium]
MSTRQAVLLIHGIGEQKPMSTLRRFVDAVWTCNKAIHHQYAGSGIWSKPDNASRNFELRRLTTPQNVAEIETHFFEFYWAHLMEGTSYGHVLAWARSLLLRRPSKVPRQLRSVYWLLWVVLFAALVLAVQAAYAKVTGNSAAPPWLSVASSLALLPLTGFIVLKIVGDAARYLHVAPTNIQRRHEIREAGIALLKELHEPERNYSRIIIVGHSLGTVIGYDMLTHAWLDFNRQHTQGEEQMDALKALEELARSDQPYADAVQVAQRKYFKELQDNGSSWRVTDFVTLGSPLSHAAILLANDAADLRNKQEDREFPRCLPALENVVRDKVMLRRFSYEVDRKVKTSYRLPHHAAVFGPTRWTNLFFPCRALVWGDLVGGPLNGVMGESIRDVPVRTSRRFGLFSHTLYWAQSKKKDESHIAALRQALDLIDERGAKL